MAGQRLVVVVGAIVALRFGWLVRSRLLVVRIWLAVRSLLAALAVPPVLAVRSAHLPETGLGMRSSCSVPV